MTNISERNSERCEKIMERYLELDKDERIPLPVTLHLLRCRRCRTQVRLLSLAEKTAAEPLEIPIPLNDMTITAVIRKINPKYDEESMPNPISMRKWIVGGVIMIALMTVFGLFTNSNSNRELIISFYLLFGAIITAYCAIFIASNMDFFVKKINTLKISL